MTDTTLTPTKGGFARAGFGALYMDICQHLTPALAGYLNMHWPILGTDLSFEIVVFSQATLAAAIIKWTPTHFVQSVTNGIVFVKSAIRTWRNAAQNGE